LAQLHHNDVAICHTSTLAVSLAKAGHGHCHCHCHITDLLLQFLSPLALLAPLLKLTQSLIDCYAAMAVLLLSLAATPP